MRPVPCPDCFGLHPERCPEHSAAHRAFDAALARQAIRARDPYWFSPPIPIHLDRGPVMLRFSCVQCGTSMRAALEPEEILRQLEADGRVTIERACPRCEQIITVFVEGTIG